MVSDADKIRKQEARLAARGIDRWGFPVAASPVVCSGGGNDDHLFSAGVITRFTRFDRKQTGKGSYVEDRLLRGLRELCRGVRKGQTLSRTEIAAACQVDKDTIRGIEKQAIKKIRARLGAGQFLQLGDFLRQLSENSNPSALYIEVTKK